MECLFIYRIIFNLKKPFYPPFLDIFSVLKILIGED